MPPHEGFGPEDWLWNIETTAAGIRHEALEKTLFFYRTRRHGGVNNQHATSILPKIEMDKLAKEFPITRISEIAPSTKDNHPKDLLQKTTKYIYRSIRPTRKLLPIEFRQRYGHLLRKLYNICFDSNYSSQHIPQVFFQAGSPSQIELERELISACQIEPAISIAASQIGSLPVWDPLNSTYAEILQEVLTKVSDNSEVVIWVPWLGVGGADKVAINYATALKNSSAFDGKISIIATYFPEKTKQEMIPDSINFVQLPEKFRDLSQDAQRRLIGQLFIQLESKLAISVNCFDVTNALQDYSHQMTRQTNIFLTLFAFDKIAAGLPVNPITDDSQRRFIDHISGIITDNSVTKIMAEEILGTEANFIKVNYQPVIKTIPALDISTSAFNDTEFNEKKPFKLLWPHRLDKEKRPEVLIDIARTAKHHDIPIEISVYGQVVLSGQADNLLSEFEKEGIIYKGNYSGLSSLPTENYHALLLTSESEGMPLVIVESLILGLPVIATNVGGISDLIKNKISGMLVNGPEDIAGFMTSFKLLMSSNKLRQKIIHKGYEIALLQHSWEHFLQNSIYPLEGFSSKENENITN